MATIEPEGIQRCGSKQTILTTIVMKITFPLKHLKKAKRSFSFIDSMKMPFAHWLYTFEVTLQSMNGIDEAEQCAL